VEIQYEDDDELRKGMAAQARTGQPLNGILAAHPPPPMVIWMNQALRVFLQRDAVNPNTDLVSTHLNA
jgi:hypothetical protein